MAKWNIQPLKGLLYADLFCNIGGFSWGFHEAGAECAFAVDNYKPAIEFYRKNISKNAVCSDIRNYHYTGSCVDLLLFGFPCNSFSIVGKREGIKSEKYGNLFLECCRLLKETAARYFIAENVANIVNNEAYIYIYNSFQQAGYNVLAMTLDFADLGNPSHRRRVLFFGSKKGLPVFFPERLKCLKHKHIDARNLLFAKLENIHGRKLLPAALRKLEKGDFCREVPPLGASQTVCANHSDHILTLKDGYSLNKLAFPLLQSFPPELFANYTPSQCRRFAGMAVPPVISRRLAVEFARFLGVMPQSLQNQQ